MTKFELGTINGVVYSNEDSVKDGYPQFEQAVIARFNSIVSTGVKLFKTNAVNIFDTYLAGLPEENGARQHFDCNACRSFFNKYGGLVMIDESGNTKSVLWDEYDVPKFFTKSVKAVKRLVLNSTVVGVFLSDEKTLGHPVTGEWTHIHAKLPSSMVYRSRLLTAGQEMAKKREEFGMINRALQDFSMDTVNKALALVDSEALYRGDDKVKPNLEWFKALLEKTDGFYTSEQRRNIIWSAIAEAPNGFTHIRSNTTGTLLKDINDGLSTRSIIARFEEKMSTYMRSQSAPSENAIYEAEKLVAKLGIENSLLRRYAKIEEVPLSLWKNKGKVLQDKPVGGVFGHLTPKAKVNDNFDLPTSVMTWEKFQRTVLPTADGIEVKVDNPNRFMALVTAVDETSENILQWDNPFSWYYHGGIDGEIKRRVEEAGGRYEDNEIRASLIWEGLTDLDLHCITPNGDHIMYNNKMGRCGGFLDLDMNGLDKNSHTPVENMRWTFNAPQGRYKFYVHNFSEKVNGFRGTPFRVELEINGRIYHYEGKALKGGQEVTVFEFDYVKGQESAIRSNSTVSTEEAWSVPANSFVKVNGITSSPNLWEEIPVTQAGTHVFFLLEGVKDSSEGKGRGFFNEMLKPDLRQIRKTLELFTAQTPIEDADEATACGVGYSKDSEWNLTVKVTSGNSSRIIKIDRWD
ncbi:YfaP family protein [Peribacillus asahii]|uniref:YfaP family protein n=1 Tax=Peribacillus asahii TaxID=228899 RepID=UPI0038293E52